VTRLRLTALGIVLAVAAGGSLEAQTEAPAKASSPGIFAYSDTSLSWSFNFTTREPNVQWSAAKNVFTLNHIDAWKYGSIARTSTSKPRS